MNHERAVRVYWLVIWRFVMNRNSILPFGILAAGVLAACMTCRAQVYSTGTYSGNTDNIGVCRTTLPYPPFTYNLTELSWIETSNGIEGISFEHKSPGDFDRQYLEVNSGSEIFYLPMDSDPPTTFLSGDKPPITKGSGNLGTMLLQCITNRGGHTTTNALPAVEASWFRASRTNEDVIILDGDRFKETQNLLEQSYGKPGFSTSENVNGHSINYAPAQIGVFLNLTGTWDPTTIISIVGKQKP
ncbi:MAG TPA: hypothetical protein VGI03_16135 [Verrucomicrobiae bacterium]|jgi:hypothetical protein